ncbi:MAG: DUF664 domain-containing protein [Streptosporangiales bacterium]|nr:DUF664 domain-containing protein [Streptosporangiales bacterium]
MPTLVAAETDERDALLSYLEAQRGAVHRAGLTDEQANATPSASELSVGGLIKHLTNVEFNWVQVNMAGRTDPNPPSEENWADNFRLVVGETLADAQERYRQVAAETEAFVQALPDLDQMYDLPKAPWFPDEPRSARWILLTLIQETARHAGHADVVRETLDGATAFELIAKESGTAMPWLENTD